MSLSTAGSGGGGNSSGRTLQTGGAAAADVSQETQQGMDTASVYYKLLIPRSNDVGIVSTQYRLMSP